MKRRLPLGLPVDYRGLFAVYRKLIVDEASTRGVTPAEVVAKLKEVRVIESFSIAENIPMRMTWDEAVDFVGTTTEGWHETLKKTCTLEDWLEIRPNTLKRPAHFLEGAEPGPAEPWDMGAVYFGPDILRVAEYFDEHGLPRSRPKCDFLVERFREHLVSTLTKAYTVVLAPVVDAEADAPVLPTDYVEMEKTYGTYMFEQVRRISMVKSAAELEEVYQQMWLNLVQSDVLGKFREAASTKLPRTLTMAEVRGYLGVTAEQWANAMETNRKRPSFWMPKPVKGSPVGEDSLFLTEDIQTLEASGFLKGRRALSTWHPEVTGRGFKSYLVRAIQNHFKNLIRTRTRRHKERVLDTKTGLSSDGTGVFVRTATIEDAFSWEENLTGMDVEMEGMIDLARQLSRYNVDPHTEDGRAVLDLMTQGFTVRSALKQLAKEQVRVLMT